MEILFRGGGFVEWGREMKDLGIKILVADVF